MTIVIPTNGTEGLKEIVADHFGRCATYTFLDKDGNIIKTIDNNSRHNGGEKLPPEVMKDEGADILLCKALGPNAINLCKKIGIEVYVDNATNVEEIFNRWKTGSIAKAAIEDACADHTH